MSHFTVMVFGDDAEKQLAPFQENNMGDCSEQHLPEDTLVKSIYDCHI